MQVRKPIPKRFGNTNETEIKFLTDEAALQNLDMVVSTHVDDFKGAATEATADAFMDMLEAEFGKLTRQKRAFEHCGILHEHTPGEVRCTQDHYVKQLRVILEDLMKQSESR